jgi:hypothetical protein
MSSHWFQVRLIRPLQPVVREKWARPTAAILALLFLMIGFTAILKPPYLARIEFEKVCTNPADHFELKRERWTASVTYVFRENVKNNELAVNPLGLTIVRFRADQAFS